MGEAALARVQVDGRDPLPDIHQGDVHVHRGGRFARAALLVAEHDDVRERGLSRARLNRHDATSGRIAIRGRRELSVASVPLL